MWHSWKSINSSQAVLSNSFLPSAFIYFRSQADVAICLLLHTFFNAPTLCLGLYSSLCLEYYYYVCMSISYWASQVVLVVNNSPANAGDIRDTGSNPGLGRSPREENINPLQYSCLEYPMDRGAWRATIHGVTKSQTWLKQLSMHPRTMSYLSRAQKLPPLWVWPHLVSPRISIYSQLNVHQPLCWVLCMFVSFDVQNNLTREVSLLWISFPQ